MVKISARNRRGFTILELTIAMTVSAALMAGLGMMIAQSLKSWSSGTSRANSENAAAIAVDKLWMDIRPGSTATVSSDSTQLTVQIPPLITDANGEKYYDKSGTKTAYTYYVSNSILYRKIGSASATVFARDISEAEFSCTGSNVTLTITAANQVGSSQTEQECTTQVVMRNY